jgi:hypothetical protein
VEEARARARTAVMKDSGAAVVWDETLRLPIPADMAAKGTVRAPCQILLCEQLAYQCIYVS